MGKQVEEVVVVGVWAVTHPAGQQQLNPYTGTYHPEYKTTLVQAPTQEEALKFFNKLASRRSNWPHMWQKVDICHVKPVVALTKRSWFRSLFRKA